MYPSEKPLRLLIIEDNPGDLVLFESYLAETGLPVEQLHRSETLAGALALLDRQRMDIVFLDLTLPDTNGRASFTTLNGKISHTPIVVLSGLSDRTMALDCITLGAQDYLLKDELNASMLSKSIPYSIERKRNLEKIRDVNEQYELIGRITNDVIWRWDFTTNEVKSPADAFFGFTCEEITPDFMWWMEKVHPEDKKPVLDLVDTLLQGTKESAQAEYRFRDAYGHYRHVYNRAFLLRDEQQKPFGAAGAIMDVTERHMLQEQLMNQQLYHQKKLTEATILGQEKEKEVLGKELHDNINQMLATVKLYLDLAETNESMRTELIGRSRKNLMEAIDQIRKLSHSMISPVLGDHGLADALQELVEGFNLGGTFSVQLECDFFDENLLDEGKKLMLYRVVQEQLNNIVKHANASEVLITLFCTDQITLSVEDNGVGFDPDKKPTGIGLRNIFSRVSFYSGEVHINSAPGKGTMLMVTLPLEGHNLQPL